MPGKLNMVKLCVGAHRIDDLIDWQNSRRDLRLSQGLDPRPRHVTRMRPKRADELLDGGSLYWVIKGNIMVRQRIEGLEEQIGEDGIRKCGLVLDPQLYRTATRRKRAFQGWRYLTGTDAPRDIGLAHQSPDDIPVWLADELDGLGIVSLSE
ncbi:MAG: DUF1489 domain-containing protein [Pseudomonadota bacterium]